MREPHLSMVPQQTGMLHSHSVWGILHIQEDPYRNFGTIAIEGIRKNSETSNHPETLRASKSLQQLDSDDILILGKVTPRFGGGAGEVMMEVKPELGCQTYNIPCLQLIPHSVLLSLLPLMSLMVAFCLVICHILLTTLLYLPLESGALVC